MLSTTLPARSRSKFSVAAMNANRKARLLELPGRLRATDVAAVFERYPVCLCCGTTEAGELLTLDHIRPFALQGPNVPDNLAILCRTCNCRKYTKTIDYRKELQ